MLCNTILPVMNLSGMCCSTILPKFFESVKNLSGMFCNTIFWICHESISNVLQHNFAQNCLNLSQIYQECFAIQFCSSWIYYECFTIQFCPNFFESEMNLSGIFCNTILPKVFWICHKSIRKDLQYDLDQHFLYLSPIYQEFFAILFYLSWIYQ